MKIFKLKFIAGVCLLFSVSFLISCGGNSEQTKVEPLVNEFEILLNYLETNGDYINSNEAPSKIDAYDVFYNMPKKALIIDIRDQESYSSNHIKGALNVEPDSILSFFENIIQPSAFDTIILTCDIGVRSAFVTSILRLLGYDNVFSLKFGMCAWNKIYADEMWLKAIKSNPEVDLEQTVNPIPKASGTPVVNTGELYPYDILRERAHSILADSIKKYFVSIDDIKDNLSDYFIIKYFPEEMNEVPHLKGAVRFEPHQSLHSNSMLLNIPADRPIIVYCYTATKSSSVVAFLRILGYEAYSLKYGSNAFMYNSILNVAPDFAFTPEHVYNFPLTSSGKPASLNIQTNPIKVKVKGGC